MFTCDTNCCFFPPCQEHVPSPTTLPVLSAGWLLLTPLSSRFFPDCFGVWCSVFGCLQRVGPGSLRVSKPSVLGTVLSGGSPPPAPRLTSSWAPFSGDCCGPSPCTEHAQRTLPGIRGGVQASRLRGAPGSATWSCPQGVRALSPVAPALIYFDLGATRQYFLFWLPLVDLCPPHLLHPLRFLK